VSSRSISIRVKRWAIIAPSVNSRPIVPRAPPPGGTTTALVPVEIVDEPAGAGLTLVSPEGYRIEGLGVDDAAALLRRLR
jgi:hypothetical protein